MGAAPLAEMYSQCGVVRACGKSQKTLPQKAAETVPLEERGEQNPGPSAHN